MQRKYDSQGKPLVDKTEIGIFYKGKKISYHNQSSLNQSSYSGVENFVICYKYGCSEDF